MKINSIIVALLTLMSATPMVDAQATLQIPKLGSAERTALLDCLRAEGSAENPDSAFKDWHTKFIASHKSCPVEIFPAHF